MYAPIKILIVEDDLKAAGYLHKGLSEAGFSVDVAHDGSSGLELLCENAYQLALLDVVLPGIDGWQILKRLRDSGRATAVIFLTGLESVDDRVKGLELGADDYLVKPAAFPELLARIRLVLRRASYESDRPVLQVADLQLDLLRRRAVRAGRTIDLAPKEFALLELLLRRQGEILPRSMIASQVWDMYFDADTNVVDVAVRRLRAKIDDGFEPKLIRTVRGMGYVLEVTEQETARLPQGHGRSAGLHDGN